MIATNANLKKKIAKTIRKNCEHEFFGLGEFIFFSKNIWFLSQKYAA